MALQKNREKNTKFSNRSIFTSEISIFKKYIGTYPYFSKYPYFYSKFYSGEECENKKCGSCVTGPQIGNIKSQHVNSVITYSSSAIIVQICSPQVLTSS